jgi:hypothetical protein
MVLISLVSWGIVFAGGKQPEYYYGNIAIAVIVLYGERRYVRYGQPGGIYDMRLVDVVTKKGRGFGVSQSRIIDTF